MTPRQSGLMRGRRSARRQIRKIGDRRKSGEETATASAVYLSPCISCRLAVTHTAVRAVPRAWLFGEADFRRLWLVGVVVFAVCWLEMLAVAPFASQRPRSPVISAPLSPLR